MRKSYQYIYLENYFHKNVHIQLFNKYFYIKEKSKLCFEDLISVINDFFFYQTQTSICLVNQIVRVADGFVTLPPSSRLLGCQEIVFFLSPEILLCTLKHSNT
jgi:hypothetical protein